MKVFVYYNLHKKVWSIKALEGHDKGLVVGHSPRVLLRDAVGKVSEKGRQRVIREKCKNVHAGIVGTLVHTGGEGYFPGLEVTYNPYKYQSFVYKDTGRRYDGSEFCYMADKKVYVI